MDNSDLSNLLLLADSADNRECYPRLTDEQIRRGTFSKRSTTITTTEQAEQQQLLSTGDGQIPGQRVLANFDISLAPSIPARLIVDEPVVDESEDPFVALAAYQPRTFDNDTQQPLEGNLGFLGDSNTSEAVLAEPDGNEVHEPPEQPQSKSDAQGIIIHESRTPDTVLDKCSGKRRASEPSSLIKESVDPHVDDFLRTSGRLTEKRQKPDSTETKLSLFPLGMKTRALALVKSTASQKNTEQSPDQSLHDRVKKETEQWIVRLGQGAERRYVCGYPNCGLAFKHISHLKAHIFRHIGISTYQCSYPECSDNRYFRDNTQLERHLESCHKKEKPFRCTLCDKRFGWPNSYKRHMFRMHKLNL